MTEEGPLDSTGARAAALSTPAAIRANLEAVQRIDVPVGAPVSAVVLVAGAEAGVTAQAVSAIAASRLRHPLVVATDDRLPSWIDETTLVLALSPSPGARSTDGHVLELAPRAGRWAPIVETTAALAVMDRFGVLVGALDELAAAADVLDARVAEAGDERSAEVTLARRIGRTMVLAYGAGPIGAAAASAWKASVNRLAKVPAFANSIPGLDHDEICGWAQHGDVTRQVFTLVMLRHGLESDDESKRMDVTAETCDEIVAGWHTVTTDATSAVAAMFDLMMAGELVALDMAAQAEIDPGPTPILERYA